MCWWQDGQWAWLANVTEKSFAVSSCPYPNHEEGLFGALYDSVFGAQQVLMVSGRGREVWPIQKQALIPSCTYAVFLSLRRLQCTSPAQSKLLCFLIGLRAILLIKFDNKLLFVPPDIVGNNLSLHHKGIFTLFSSVRVIAGKKRQECFFCRWMPR